MSVTVPHPLLARLHKHDPNLPPDKQDKRAVAHIDKADWDTWLHGIEEQALSLIKPQPMEVFDLTDAIKTDAILAAWQVSGSTQGTLL